MEMKRYFKNILIWLLPTIFLLLALIPMQYPVFFPLILQIVVTVCAIVIAYFLFTEKPPYYLPWGIAFIIIICLFNPIVHFNVTMGFEIPLALIAAIIFIANWWFVFRKRA